MSDSVAAKIRFDLIANIANFQANLREADRSLGDFYTSAEKYNKRFDAAKNVAERAKNEQGAWIGAMRGEGPMGQLRNPLGVPAAELIGVNDPLSASQLASRAEFNKQVRQKNLLQSVSPWGTSETVTLSREAAAHAAAVGAGGAKIKAAYRDALREIAGAGAGAAGMGGPFSSLMGFAAGHPLATGGAIAAGWLIKGARDRHQLALETAREASMLGQGVEDVSRLKSAGVSPEMGTHFLRAQAEGSKGFSRLGLDADKLAGGPMKGALLEVADAFERVKNPADRAQAAFELFGRSGAEMLPILENLRQKLDNVSSADIVKPGQVEQARAFSAELKAVFAMAAEANQGLGKMLGGGSGFLTQEMRGIQAIGYALSGNWKGFDKAEARWKQEDYRVEHAEELERARVEQEKLAAAATREVNARREAAKLLQPLTDKLRDLQKGEGASELAHYREALQKAGMKGPALEAQVGYYASTRERVADLSAEEDRRNQVRANVKDYRNDPDKVAKDEMYWINRMYREKKISADDVVALEKRTLQEYYSKKHGLDIAGLEKESRSPTQNYRRRMEAIDLAASQGEDILSKGTAAFGKKSALKELQGSLGIKDLFGDFGDRVGDLKEALGSGAIDKEQYNTRVAELRKSAAGELTKDVKTVAPVAAMTAGSREAHAAIIAAQLADPKTELTRQSLTKLDRIIENTSPRNAAAGGKTLDLG